MRLGDRFRTGRERLGYFALDPPMSFDALARASIALARALPMVAAGGGAMRVGMAR